MKNKATQETPLVFKILQTFQCISILPRRRILLPNSTFPGTGSTQPGLFLGTSRNHKTQEDGDNRTHKVAEDSWRGVEGETQDPSLVPSRSTRYDTPYTQRTALDEDTTSTRHGPALHLPEPDTQDVHTSTGSLDGLTSHTVSPHTGPFFVPVKVNLATSRKVALSLPRTDKKWRTVVVPTGVTEECEVSWKITFRRHHILLTVTNKSDRVLSGDLENRESCRPV